jgi:predicted DNA-binding ribbon-helix-helix protein
MKRSANDEAAQQPRPADAIVRVQTGIRIERRILKVLKALAEHQDMTLGDLIEGIVLHVFEGKLPFAASTLKTVQDLKRIYGLELTAASSHQLGEAAP